MGQKIKIAEISDYPKPDADRVDNERVRVYRPRMDNVPTGNRQPAPKKIVPATDLPSVPTDRRLTPNIKREKPQNTEGGEEKPQDMQLRRDDVPREQPNVKKDPAPIFLPRPVERQPRRENIPPPDVPDVKKEPEPKMEPRPQDRQPRMKELPQEQPDVKRQPPRTQDRQPRREDVPRETPPKTQPKVDQPRKEKVNPPPAKEKAIEPPKKKNRDNTD